MMLMRVEERILDYIDSSNAPVTREEIDDKFARYASSKKLALALTRVRRKRKLQFVRKDGNKQGMEIFIPLSLIEQYDIEKIPKATAKGICVLPRSEQDLYPSICHQFCPSFPSCGPDMKAYLENNGLEWKYDKAISQKAKLKRFFERK